MKPTPFLGVVTAPVPELLAAQINLPAGFGLVVQEVVPESPAVTAGLQRFDVLTQLNDQKLTDPDQLATLVRSFGKDAEVSLTLIRKGQEQKLSLKIGERLMPERREADARTPSIPREFERSRGDVEERMRRMQEQIQQRGKEMQERMQKFHERMREWQKNPSSPTPDAPDLGDLTAHPEPGPRDLLHEAGPGGAPEVRVKQGDGTTTWNTANAHVVVRDGTGSMEVNSTDGKRTATAKDADGKVIFTGPIDTDEQRAALPEEVRKKLEKIHTRSRVGGGHAEADTGVAARGDRPAPPAPRSEEHVQ